MQDNIKYPFYLSNSMLRDWEVMCQREWCARWINQDPSYELNSDAIMLGNLFEQNVIGVSVGNKVTTPTPEFIKRNKASYDRMLLQAKICKSFLKILGGKVKFVQKYLYAVVVDSEGRDIPICGNLDIVYEWVDKAVRAIIDLKFTADTDNTYGAFAWGRPDTMDMSQACQYKLLHRHAFPGLPDPEFHYWVFDHKAEMKKSLMKINISEYTLEQHIERLSKAYHEIEDAKLFDTWKPIQQYNVCNVCKNKCEYERLMPDFIEIDK